MNIAKINQEFTETIGSIYIPQFFETVSGLFEDEVLFDKNNLLTNFELNKCDTNISFSDLDPELYSIDVENEQNAKFSPLNKEKSEQLLKIRNYSLETKKENLVTSLLILLEKCFFPIAVLKLSLL